MGRTGGRDDGQVGKTMGRRAGETMGDMIVEGPIWTVARRIRPPAGVKLLGQEM